MYLNKLVSLAPSAVGELDVSTGTVLVYFVAPMRMKIKQCQAMVSTALVSTGAVALTFYRRPTHGSTSGEVSLAALTVPAATAVGITIYKNLSLDGSTVSVNAGEEIVVKLTTAATTSGKVICNFVADEDPEVDLNQANLVASA